MIEPLLWLAASYLLGSIPTSYLAGRWFRGIDLREHGSRNLGATNLYRIMGWRFAVPVGLFDVLKGAVPVLLFAPQVPAVPHFPTLCGVAAMVGHTLSPFVGFKGGKGVATAAGMLLGLAPGAVGVAALVWAVLVRLTGYVSVGSIASAVAFPAADFLLYPARRTLPDVGFDLLIAAFIVWKHRANIQRLLSGTENRFGKRAAAPPSAPAAH
ncbi:MAG: glycerol-3-phosphate 1-O-acyltransferase PlsY [Gemmatimonadota bacterium]|nr:glycerol-3-phosphate 1-O-acyltransferase PlsY [Gemmatimonadota bacterium]